jgi:hypothetical protein
LTPCFALAAGLCAGKRFRFRLTLRPTVCLARSLRRRAAARLRRSRGSRLGRALSRRLTCRTRLGFCHRQRSAGRRSRPRERLDGAIRHGMRKRTDSRPRLRPSYDRARRWRRTADKLLCCELDARVGKFGHPRTPAIATEIHAHRYPETRLRHVVWYAISRTVP